MDRDEFLQRVRQAAAAGSTDLTPLPPPGSPSGKRSAHDLAERFKIEHEAVLGRVHLISTLQEAQRVLSELLQGARTFVRSPHALLDDIGLALAAAHLSPAPAAQADVGVTGCELAVAATGSVVLSSAWGRLASLLPYHHIVVLDASQLVADLEDAYLTFGPQTLPGALGFHTGPSKSADIEQTMALGVHGPGRTDVIVLRRE
ncbi:LutC/YkgG family protein [Deinococcus peraridilitoris]|uniref:LUD domain-containing protein n=1 Tax=Deinococcus peraridilitoris (strain DSM 19664 / LMG 22246 / CIP 109416 / KR-200) TaxID=937777 RepID=L0A5C0_DEIPD|nr:lactate utilization protein [Deinococcus peraridilitoris]AFZ68205.1 hypothetical protein Deipe_2741 [Deinococcus peraridilitoris DSM 19664]